MPPSVSVFGSAGFTGALTARLLYRHPSLELRALTARSDVGRRLDDLYPFHRVPLELEELDVDRHAEVDAAVVAYPHGAAAPLVAELRARGVRVVDLSADFRLHDPVVYGRWYREHQAPELLGEAVYGLPELYREQIRGAGLVANPGCYPTASLLALAPLARAGVIEDLVIDAKSGVSGAGRTPSEKTHFVTADENVNAYGVPSHRHIPEIEQELAALGADLPITFIPHLVPLDQGELVSCYVTLTDPGDVRSLEELYADTYADRAVRRAVDEAARRPRRPRDQHLPDLGAPRRARRARDRVRGDRQPVEGRRIAGRAEPQPDVRTARGRGDRRDRVPGTRGGSVTATHSFFQSRWIEVPGNVSEPGGGLPQGFKAAGVACGIKPSGQPDLGLLVSDAPATTSAARFTSSGTQSAPVLLCRERVTLTGIRAVVVNSGNANAATGRPGFENAAKMQGAAALASRCSESAVAVASTGVIGVPLPVSSVMTGIVRATHALRPDGEIDFAHAIRTTDALDKHACLDVELSAGTVRLTAQAKGAGMISPNFATLLCFVQTDAALSPETCDLLLGVTVKRSFERISVDGQLSTSDTVILQASGESGVQIEPETEDELRFGEALDAMLRQLALNIARDGEGARRVGRVVVRGGDGEGVHRVARAVADSPLVKTALYGGDPNWGRIIQAVGMAMPGTAPLPVGITIEGIEVCARGQYVPHDPDALRAAVQGEEIEYEIGLPGEGAETELYFSDLGHEYVTLNAEYTT